MDQSQVQQVRRFNRLVTQRIGALEDSYLGRGRPLGEARLIFETGADGADLGTLRTKLGLDSLCLSRLLDSLKAQGLIKFSRKNEDSRRHRVCLTRKGRAELVAYDKLSNKLAASMLEGLDRAQTDRLATAMGEVERLFRAASVEITAEGPDSTDARWCLAEYFRELAARFETGFDLADGASVRDEVLTLPTGCFVVARLDGNPVGCGALKRVDRTTGEIKRVWTASSARGIGVARRVLRTLEATARDIGLKTVRLDTNRALREAHALYRKEGYQEVGAFNDNFYAHHWFSKQL
jgi:DNA-binding MarR family transcriptional regulator/N-acetylglutamate synthase-like GNAT family acetyltransferase